MRASEISRVSQRTFLSSLPAHWATRSQEDQEDYGIDFEIEPISPGERPTGFIFKIQLKGTARARYNKSGDLVYASASVERFQYYIKRLRIPLLFVVCDTKTGTCLWQRVQGNRDLEAAFDAARAAGRKTFTVTLPRANVLSRSEQSATALLEAVSDAHSSITYRGLRDLPPVSVRDHCARDMHVEATESHFRLLAGIAANESIRRMTDAGDLEGACEKAQRLFESESESPHSRLLGGFAFVSAYARLLFTQKLPDAMTKASHTKLAIAGEMLRISRSSSCEKRTQRFVRIYARAARMKVNGETALALAMSERRLDQQTDAVVAPITRLQRLQVSAQVARDFFRLRYAIYALGSNSHFTAIPHALAELAEAILPYVVSLRITGNNDLASAYVDALFALVPFCVQVVAEVANEADAYEILVCLGTRFLFLADGNDPSATRQMRERLEQAIDCSLPNDCLAQVKHVLDEVTATSEAVSSNRAEPTMDELRAHFTQQAAALGVDLRDLSDDIAQVIRIGLADLDPTRVLKTCKHICVLCTSRGIPAEMLGLPTAGFKRVVCLKFGHSVESLNLDTAYEHFAKGDSHGSSTTYCESCPEKSPQSDDWKTVVDWPKHEHARYLAAKKAKPDTNDPGGS